ncbi:MAG: APC family permease [Anaerolineales bacterium]
MSDLFIRKATGLVRSWSVFDAFVYAFFSINLVTLGLYIFSQMYYFEGGLIGALLLSAFFILFEVVVYAGLISVMPRSGGDYVWQSRILGGGVGFILAVTGWWFILWLWVPLYGDMLRHMFITPVLALLGMRDAALWFAQTNHGLFIATLFTLVIVTGYILLGMKRYAQIQKVCFFGGMAGLVLMVVLFFSASPVAFRPALERNAAELFGTPAGVYQATVAAGQEAGAVFGLTGGTLSALFLTLPYVVFFNLYPNWGATLYGEVRGANDFKRNFVGMASALLFTTALGIIVLLAIDRAIGWDFYMQANGAWWSYAWGLSETQPTLPVWPYPALLAAFLSDNRALQLVLMLLMSLWWFGWSGTVFLSSTRVVFAAAFDRLLPEKVAEVDARTGTPIIALLLMVVPSIIVTWLFAYDVFGFKSLTLAATLVIAVTYLGTTIAAILLPYRKPEMYNASPIAKYKILGIPLITVAGLIFGGFLVFLLYQWLFDPNALYGIGYSVNPNGYKNGTSLVFMGVLYGVATAIYLGFKAYRKRTGIDLDKVHAEIPAE